MYHIRMKGSHYEAGFKFGSTLKKNGIVFKSCPTFDITDDMFEFTEKCLPIYQQYYPEILDEIKGMSDGQGISFKFLSTLLCSMYCFSPDLHCSCFAISNGTTMLLARNSDFLVSLEKLYMNCMYSLKDSYSFNGNTTAFIEMEDGMNEHNLAIGFTFVYPTKIKPGINAGLLLRMILEKCKTIDEAITLLKNIPIASQQTYTLIDITGKIVVIECNCDHVVCLYPNTNEDFVCTANRFNSAILLSYNKPTNFDDWDASLRQQTMLTALQNNSNKDLTFAQELLAGKYGFICQYDRKKNADTVWSCIYDVKHGQVFRVEGNPSKKIFLEDTRMKFKKT